MTDQHQTDQYQHDSARPAIETRIRLSQLMGPEHANHLGNVHGGVIMKMVDEAGSLAAIRHARAPVVTVTVDSMTFEHPVYIGNLIIIDAELTYVGRTSLETRVTVMSENVVTAERTLTNIAYVVYVALGNDGKPLQVPPLLITTPEQEQEQVEGRARQEDRKRRADQLRRGRVGV